MLKSTVQGIVVRVWEVSRKTLLEIILLLDCETPNLHFQFKLGSTSWFLKISRTSENSSWLPWKADVDECVETRTGRQQDLKGENGAFRGQNVVRNEVGIVSLNKFGELRFENGWLLILRTTRSKPASP